jgi:hypothetical protein
MARKLIPLLAVVPMGIAFGLLATADAWSDMTRILLTASAGVVIVVIGTPIAMLRLRRLPPPASGQYNAAAFELSGLYSEYPVSPVKFPRELSAPRSDPTVLLPVIRPALKSLDPGMERVLLVSDPDQRTYQGCLGEITYDVTLWPDRGRRRSVWRSLDRGFNRAIERFSESNTSDVPDRTVDRVIDRAAA